MEYITDISLQFNPVDLFWFGYRSREAIALNPPAFCWFAREGEGERKLRRGQGVSRVPRVEVTAG